MRRGVRGIRWVRGVKGNMPFMNLLSASPLADLFVYCGGYEKDSRRLSNREGELTVSHLNFSSGL